MAPAFFAEAKNPNRDPEGHFEHSEIAVRGVSPICSGWGDPRLHGLFFAGNILDLGTLINSTNFPWAINLISQEESFDPKLRT